VLKLIQNPKLDPIGKDLALCSITGVWPTDLLGRGTQNTLLCKLVRVSHARGFVLPYVPGADMDAEVDEGEQESQDSDDEEVEKAVEDTGYQGGKVLTAQPGRYTSPVAVFDFASLYPSCMVRNPCVLL
jgi:DNA polymerase delta subunit 1